MLAPQYFDPRLPQEFAATTQPPRDLICFDGAPLQQRLHPAEPVAVPDQTLPEFSLHEFGNRVIHPNWNARGVLSPFWRLYHNTQGGAQLSHDGREYPLDASHIHLIPENLRFDCAVVRPTPHLWLHFTVRPSYAFNARDPFAVPIDSTLQTLLDELRGIPLPVLDDKALRRLYFAGLSLINATFARADFPAAQPLPPALSAILRRIERSPRENLSNERLAKMCGLSVGGFTRLFTSQVGISPALYVRRIRLNHASRLLAFTEMSIEQIAEASGFPNRHYFTRMFARHAGCGPATFRKTHQSGQLQGQEKAHPHEEDELEDYNEVEDEHE